MQRQWCTTGNILHLTVGYLNATINRKTQKWDPEIGTDRSSRTLQHPRLGGYRYGLGLRRGYMLRSWTILDQTTPCFRSKPGPLRGYLEPLLTLVVEVWQLETESVVVIHNHCIAYLYRQKRRLHAPCPILTISVNGATKFVGVTSWVMWAADNRTHLYSGR